MSSVLAQFPLSKQQTVDLDSECMQECRCRCAVKCTPMSADVAHFITLRHFQVEKGRVNCTGDSSTSAVTETYDIEVEPSLTEINREAGGF